MRRPSRACFLYRSSQLDEPIHTVYEPAVCFIAQGRKRP